MAITADPKALHNLDRALRDIELKTLRRSPRISLSEWADTFRVLPPRNAIAGRWKTSTTPWLKGIMDAVSDPTIREIVLMMPSQVGKTEILLNVIGYYCHLNPAEILLVQPKLDAARAFSQERIAPLFEYSDVLHELVNPRNKNRLHWELFSGAVLNLVGSKSETDLSSRSVKVLLLDEVDRYELSVNNAGSPVETVKQRQVAHWDYKTVMVSSPGVSSRTQIYPAFLNSCQYRWEVPCIHCGEYQELLKGDPEDPWGLHWAKDANGEHRPETAEYWCKANGCVMTWADNHVIQQRGRWVARNPGHPIAGFTMSGLNSTMPGANWEKLAAEFIEAKKAQEKGNREPLKKFVTTVLAEVYADKGETLKDYELATHLRTYDPNGVAEIPADTGRLLASVDVQKNWLKYHVWAWCKDARFALVECDYIRTDPTLDSTWDTLTAALNRPFKTRNPNKPLYVAAIAVDAGYALHKRKTEEWVVKSATLARPVIGIKGRSTAGKGRLLDQPAQSKLGNYTPWLIDTHAAKEIIYEKFKVGDGPGYVSLPQWLDPDEIAQFTAEERKETVRGGKKVFEWVKIGNRRNENLDLFVYVLALTELFGIGGQMQVDKWAELELALVGVGPVTGSQAVPNAPINATPAAIQAPIPPPQPVNPPLQRGIPHRIIPMSRTPRY